MQDSVNPYHSLQYLRPARMSKGCVPTRRVDVGMRAGIVEKYKGFYTMFLKLRQ